MKAANKSIFDKSYIVEAQAIKAGVKEWPQGIPSDVVLSRDEATKKFRFMHIERPLVGWDESAEAAQARAEHLKELLCANVDLGQAQAEADQTPEDIKNGDRAANASMGVDEAKPRISSCERPTKRVWDIADSMPKASRKEVMAECVRQGIAYGTSRTQYQAWFKASQTGSKVDVRKPYQKGE